MHWWLNPSLLKIQCSYTGSHWPCVTNHSLIVTICCLWLNVHRQVTVKHLHLICGRCFRLKSCVKNCYRNSFFFSFFFSKGSVINYSPYTFFKSCMNSFHWTRKGETVLNRAYLFSPCISHYIQQGTKHSSFKK